MAAFPGRNPNLVEPVSWLGSGRGLFPGVSPHTRLAFILELCFFDLCALGVLDSEECGLDGLLCGQDKERSITGLSLRMLL